MWKRRVLKFFDSRKLRGDQFSTIINRQLAHETKRASGTEVKIFD